MKASPVFFSLFTGHTLAQSLATRFNGEVGHVTFHSFPDAESYIKVETNITSRPAVIVDSLDHPNTKTLPLFFLARKLQEMKASQIGFVIPYLAYMRQDTLFKPGEAVTSREFAALLSDHCDWLVTVEPHLHRYHNLSEIYSIPTRVAHAGDAIAAWIKQNIKNPLPIGPDKESEQWVKDVADKLSVPFVICSKERLTDREVMVNLPDVSTYQNRQAVLLDDIAATAMTLLKAAKAIQAAGLAAPICIVVHGLFAHNAKQRLIESGIKKVISCNTILDVTEEQIDISQAVSAAINPLLYP